MEIISINHNVGATTEALIANVRYQNKKIKAVYNCLTGDLMICRWYDYDDNELKELRAKLQDIFTKII